MKHKRAQYIYSWLESYLESGSRCLRGLKSQSIIFYYDLSSRVKIGKKSCIKVNTKEFNGILSTIYLPIYMLGCLSVCNYI